MRKDEAMIRYQLSDGSSILIPFSKLDKMSENDIKDLDTGNYGRFLRIIEDDFSFEEFGELDEDIPSEEDDILGIFNEDE